MYNELLCFFENKCCISNIFMKKHWLAWYLTIFMIVLVFLIFSNSYNFFWKIIFPFLTSLLIFSSLLITFYKLFVKEITNELKIDKIEIDFKSLLTREKFIPVYYEFQLKKVKDYCENKKITKSEFNNLLSFIDDDLKYKYTQFRIKEYFISIIIPSMISIMTVYLTNNEIKNIDTIIEISFLFAFITIVITLTFYSFFQIRYLVVNPRRNLLELKNVLRNID